MALVAPKELSIDKDRVELVSLEILKFSEDIEDTSELSIPEIKKLYNKVTEEEFIKIDDLSQPYVIRVVTSKESVLRSQEPDFLPEGDDFEMAESIQEILKEKNINVYGSDFKTEDLSHATEIKKQRLAGVIQQEMKNGMAELAKISGTEKIKIAKIDQVGEEIENAEIIEVPSNMVEQEK